MAEDQYLPGTPKKKLVADVRRMLAGYGVRPTSRHDWLLTWQWAHKIARSYALKTAWPSPREIASQYLVLLGARMKADGFIKLPYRARDCLTPAVVAALGGPALPALPPVEKPAVGG